MERNADVQRLFARLLGLVIFTCLGVLWLLAGFLSAADFATGYGQPLGAYTGQEDDRTGALIFLAAFVALSITIAADIWLNGKIIRRINGRPRRYWGCGGADADRHR